MRQEKSARPFVKMHGLGNDFIIFDGREDRLDLTPDQVRALADRRRGVGCDQLITLWPSERADVFMRIQNSDGSEVAACGNATRCVGHLLMEEGDLLTIETHAAILEARPQGDLIRVDMGEPQIMELTENIAGLGTPHFIDVGNPHVVFFVEDADKIPLAELGPLVENDPVFPNRTNVSFVHKQPDGSLRVRVWERGAGITQACGSAACATIVAASLEGLVDRTAIIHMDGGDLHMCWQDDNHIRMTGPVAYVYEGTVKL